MAKRQYSRVPAAPAQNAAQPWSPTPPVSEYVRQVAQPSAIINGRMDIWQYGTSFALLGNNAAQYGADRFKFIMGTAAATKAVVTYSQSTDVPTVTQAGFLLNYSAEVLFTTASSALATGDYAALRYVIEGYDFMQLAGAPFTLSFWVKASSAGIFTINLQNNSGSLSYEIEYSIISANTWERKVIVVPPPQVNAGFLTTNGWGLGLDFNIARNYAVANQGSPGVWINGNVVQTANQTNTVMTTTSGTFFLAAVKIEPGVIATPIPFRAYDQELRLCQRYYEIQRVSMSNTITSGNVMGMGRPFYVSKRIAPTLTATNVQSNIGTSTAFQTNVGTSLYCHGLIITANATGTANVDVDVTAFADF